MRCTLNKNKRARNYGLCSAAIALAAVASLGTAGSAKAEEAKTLDQLPNPEEQILYNYWDTNDQKAREYLGDLYGFLKSYLGELEKKLKSLDLLDLKVKKAKKEKKARPVRWGLKA